MANIPPNIERFNLTVIHLFNDLYDSFPTAIDVDTSMLGIKAAPEGLSGAEILTYAMCAGDVVTWLQEEGFLTIYGTDNAGTITDVRLSLKGLTLLGYVPASLRFVDRKEPIIDKIKRVLAAGTEQASTEAIKTILAAVFKLAVSSAPRTIGAITGAP